MSDPPAAPARGSRKFAVSLFADLTGYTALCERLDPEDVERAVAPLMAAMQDAVTNANGVVLNVAGDGLFAIFGVPDALPNSPSTAIHAARHMRSVATSMNEQVEGLALPEVHIGIAAGEVLVTSTGPHGSWSVIGTSVNLASRLCDAANPGEILVEESCARIVRDERTWDTPRRLSLKGQDRETVAWPLRAAFGATTVAPEPTAFVGRDAQLAALDRELAAAREENRSRLMVLRGVAGIGKSRLLAHWLAAHPDLTRWRVTCDETRMRDDLTSLYVAIDARRDVDGGTARQPQAPVDRTDPYPLVVHALRETLRRTVGDEPHVLVIENLHVSDTILGEFLLELSRHPLPVPLFVVATWRDDATGGLVEPGLLGTTITLDPLDKAESDRLLEALLVDPVDAETLAVIEARAAGHPLMVTESALHLNDLRGRTSGATLPPLAALRESLPSSVRMFVAARIDRLEPAARAVAHDLSTLGPRFTSDWVNAVLGRRAEDLLPPLEKAGILTRDEDWAFTHDLLREVAYNTLTRAQRADLHRRQLELLDAGGDPHERAEHALAWNHAVSPVDREQYAESAVAAVRESLRLAEDLYKRQARAALQAAGRATSAARDCVAINPRLAARLWSLEAQCLAELGRYDDALRLAAQAEQAASESGDVAARLAPMMTKGLVLSNLRRYESARQTLDDVAQLAKAIDDRLSQAHAVRLLADTWRHSLIGRFVALTEEAYQLFDAASDRDGAGECARMLAYLSSVGGYARFTKWRAIAGELTDPDDLRATAALAKGDALAMGGRLRYPEYEAAGLVLVDAGRALEAPDLRSEGLLNLADAQLHLGNPAGALQASQSLIELATELGDRRMRAAAAAAAVQPLLRTGDLSRSREEIRIAREMSGEFGLGEEVFISSTEAVALADRGCWSEAAAVLRSTLESLIAGGFVLAALPMRAESLRLAAVREESWSQTTAGQLVADAHEIEAPLIASYARALDAWARASRGEAVDVGAPAQGACLEELAIRADTTAVTVGLNGGDPAPRWREARECWKRFGYTIWLARAQARCGDLTAANETLDLLDSPAEARAWALGS